MAGATLKVDRSFPNYSTADWSYAVTFAGEFNLTVPGVEDAHGDLTLYHVIAAPADTAKLNPGGAPLALQFVELLTAKDDSGEKFLVGRGRITVEPDLSALNDGDALTFNQKTLKAIRAEIYSRLTNQNSIDNYSVGGRSVSKIALRDLQQLEGEYQEKCWREQNPGRFSYPVNVAFPSNEVAPSPYVTTRWRP
jgi:hypothetical protein